MGFEVLIAHKANCDKEIVPPFLKMDYRYIAVLNVDFGSNLFICALYQLHLMILKKYSQNENIRCGGKIDGTPLYSRNPLPDLVI